MIKVKQPVISIAASPTSKTASRLDFSVRGKAHNQMLLPAEANDEATAAAFAGGKALV